MLTVENIGKTIYVFNANNTKVDNEFKPYFYYEDENGECVSLFGKKLSKVICNNPSDVPRERENYENTYESDVIYQKRYIIDKFDEIEKETFRKWYIDIELEITKAEFPDIETVPEKINCIGIYDTIDKMYHQFSLPSHEIENASMFTDGNIKHYYYKTEVAMLKGFAELTKKRNPNILIAWFGNGFDFPYIYYRMQKIGVNPDLLSPINSSYIKKVSDQPRLFTTNIKGRVLLDLMQAYKKICQGERESFSLEYVSKYELGKGKDEYEGTLQELYEKDFRKFLDYNIQDVRLLKLLDEKLQIVEFFDEVRRFAHCDFTDVYYSTRIHDCYLLYMARKKGLVLPRKQNNTKIKFEGAYVKEPRKGLYKNVAVFDLKSLYPSIMMTFNMSPETFMQSFSGDCINLYDKFYFSKDKKGLIPEVIEKPMLLRSEKKKEMRKYEKGSIEHHALDLAQYALKVIPNSLYGVLGNPYFRLFKNEIPEAVAFMGRKILEHSIEQLGIMGLNVLAGDTDSIFVEIGDMSISDCEAIAGALTESYKDFLKLFNVDKNYLVMEFEKVYKRILFIENSSGHGVKKRYTGLLKYYDGKDVDITNIKTAFEVKGFETKRADQPQVIRDWQKQLFWMVLHNEPREKVKAFINSFRSKFWNYKEELGIPAKLRSKVKVLTIHARAAQTSNERHGTNFNQGSSFKYVYVSRHPTKWAFQNVIAFDKKLPEAYDIDYDRMWERLCAKKIEVVFNALDWELGNTRSLFGKW